MTLLLMMMMMMMMMTIIVKVILANYLAAPRASLNTTVQYNA